MMSDCRCDIWAKWNVQNWVYVYYGIAKKKKYCEGVQVIAFSAEGC